MKPDTRVLFNVSDLDYLAQKTIVYKLSQRFPELDVGWIGWLGDTLAVKREDATPGLVCLMMELIEEQTGGLR